MARCDPDDVARPDPGDPAPHGGRRCVVGIGCTSRATASDVAAAFAVAVTRSSMPPNAMATIDSLGTDARVTALGLPVLAFGAAELAAVDVPTPSDVVRAKRATASVAEAAALLGAGPGAALVVTKLVIGPVTVAVATTVTIAEHA